MGQPAARVGDMHSCPIPATPSTPPHLGGPITGPGAPTVLIGNKPAAVVGDLCTCAIPAPDTIIQGSTSVLIGGKPAARIGDVTAHGGKIVAGNLSVIVG